MQHLERDEQLIQGGQGRSAAEVEASFCLWFWMVAIALSLIVGSMLAGC